MTKIKIDKNIPIPFGRGTYKYPFADMEVGDSFVVPTAERSGLSGSARYFAKQFPQKKRPVFTQRTSKTKDEVRIWRVK